MSTTNNVLTIEKLTVAFDGFNAIESLNLQVEKDELRVIIGPNGAGKTTLLDLICGRTRATSGSIRFKDIEISKEAEHKIVRAGIGRKFQTPSIYENLSVFQNLEVSYPSGRGVFGALAFTCTPQVRERMQAVAEEIGLQDVLAIEAGLLSHGQKQWLEIAMLLVQHPKLLLLDEPVAGMSLKERDQTVDLIQRISATQAIVVIEHDMDFVKKLSGNVTVLHQGAILCEGSIEQVQIDPRVREVYLGD